MKEIMKAIVMAQKEISNAQTDATNQHFRSKYATLESYIEAIKGTLSKYDLAVIQSIKNDPFEMVTTLAHISGETIETRIPLILTKNDMQGLGSAIKYARRYALAAFFNVGSEDKDDDANLTVQQTQEAQKKVAPQQQAPPPQSLTSPPISIKKPTEFNPSRFSSLSTKCFSFGKFKDKQWSSLDLNDLEKYTFYFIKSAKEKNEPILPLALDLIEYVELAKLQQKQAEPSIDEINDFLNNSSEPPF
jgi:hypothetical protein